MKKIFLLAIAAVIFSAALSFAEETILFKPPLINPDTPENRELVEHIVEDALLQANSFYANYFSVVDGTGGGDAGRTADGPSDTSPDYEAALLVNFAGEQSSLSVTMTRTSDGAEVSSTALGPITSARSDHLSDLIFYLYTGFHGYLEEGMKESPAFVEEIPADVIGGSIAPGEAVQLYPYSAAITPEGNVLVGLISRCVELDPVLRIVREHGESLVKSGNYNFAYGVSVTPAGTLYLKPSTGREVYRIIEGAPRPQRIRVGLDVNGPFVALPDGSIVIIDIVKKRATRIEGRDAQDLDLYTYEYAYISAATAGPAGNLWIYDSVEGRVRIYTPEGKLVDSIKPIVSSDNPLSPLSMAVYPDGSFILYSTGQLWRFRRDGVPIWKMKNLPTNRGEPLPQMAAVAVDGNTGSIYLADVMGRRLIKLYDEVYARENGLTDPMTEKMIEMNRRITADPDNIPLLEEKARFYEELEAFETAQTAWQYILDFDPFHQEAADRLDAIEVASLKDSAEKQRRNTLEVLRSVGPESARELYSKTVQMYERILSLNPYDEETKQNYESLKEIFLRETTVPPGEKKQFIIVKTELENLFPSLMHTYRKKSAGAVTVKNGLSQPIESVRASVFIKKYMDFPVETALEDPDGELAPGAEASIPLNVLLNEAVFTLQEDLPIQARIEVTGRSGGSEVSSVINKTITLYRRTALSWDRSEKLAAFIMPNEEVVSRFAHRVLDEQEYGAASGLPEKVVRAARICDAVGKYGITYIEDPESPISEVLERESVIDTVRFPRTTLFIKSGDCDDTTALLGSLLESVGVKTAIMTSPGHVFLAMDTGEPAGNSWMYSYSGQETLSYNGTVWVPLETTVLGRGFSEVWAEASRLVAVHKPKQELEFLPVAELRGEFPPLPLSGESSLAIAIPPAEAVTPQFVRSLEGLRNSLYVQTLETLQEQAEAAGGGVKQVVINNRIGVLHARFGDLNKAESVFMDNIEENPGLISSYINLANLNLQRGRLDKAADILALGINREPDAPLLNLLLARTYKLQDRMAEAREQFRKVETAAPELAARYADFIEVEGAEARAGAEGPEFPFIWADGE
jgi:hypothetical protein